MDVIFPERTQAIKKLFGKASLVLLQEAATPKDLLQLGLSNLTKLPKKYSRGSFREKEALKILSLAKTTVGITDPIWKFELQILIPRLLVFDRS